MNRPYQICTRCVMDTTDPDIQFDEQGICNHCREMLERMKSVVNTDPQHLQQIVEQIRNEGQGKRYDCIIGVSGGVDSTYLAYLTKKLGLRPLAVHLDNGWDSELAVKNIEHILNKLGIDLYTKVLDWENFRDMQIAFLKASTPDSEIPTDHVIQATLFQTARRQKVKYVLQGANMRTEGIMSLAWSHGYVDWRYIKSVHKQFGKLQLRDFPHFSLWDRLMNYAVRRLKVVCLLNYIDYNREKAKELMEKELGWRDYGVKHGESFYTRFFQSYILRNKFGIDKRMAHLSCLVVSGEISREAALATLAMDLYPGEAIQADKEYVVKKLGLTEKEFEGIMALPPRTYRQYPNNESILRRIATIVKLGRRLGLISPQIGL